ncbi:MAG TPA: DUF4252 domain-containing protein [Gammaproteobacteria bacterium]|nr:DUF4252 domain-containing protein [Gammaproteobacteria bacterium]
MRHVSLPLLVPAVASLLLAGCGITGNFRNDPGYAEFDSPGMRDTEREIGLSLGPLPLGVARLFFGGDEDIGPMLKGLRAARVYIYDVDGDAERVEKRIAETQSKLLADGWFPVVTVNDEGDRVAVLMHADRHNKPRGMAVIVQDSEDVVLVNLIGEIQPEMFNTYMAELGVDAPRVDIDPGTLQAVVR